MHKLLYFTLFLFLFSCVSSVKKAPVYPAQETLIKDIHYLISDPNLANCNIGIYIESLNDRNIVFRQNEYKLFVPASNQKLYTTAAALELLGNDYKYSTQFYTNGNINEGILEGDLIIIGKGDPSISGRFKDDDVLAYFNDWADSLKAAGIKQINGKIVANESYFKGDKLGFGWNWDDEPYYYSAQIGALSFNDNCVDITIQPGDSLMEPVQYSVNPNTDYVEIVNNSFTIHPDSQRTFSIWRERAKNSIILSGGLPADRKKFTQSITVEDPAAWFAENFVRILEKKGIKTLAGYETSQRNITYKELKEYTLIFKHFSLPLYELVKVVNKGSHNFYAEQIFKTIGAEIKKKGTARNSADAIKNWLAGMGVSENQALIYDGSGLSRMNLVSPFSTAALLREMYFSENFDSFNNSLPIAGVDGTLKRRMKNSAAENNVRAKTGYVMHVRSLSGYVSDQAGNDYLFSIMVNHYSVPTPYINKLQDKICILLANYNPN